MDASNSDDQLYSVCPCTFAKGKVVDVSYDECMFIPPAAIAQFYDFCGFVHPGGPEALKRWIAKNGKG